MSAIWMTCPECGTTYVTGVVGKTPWPAHKCPAHTRTTDAQVQRALKRAEERGLYDPMTKKFRWDS